MLPRKLNLTSRWQILTYILFLHDKNKKTDRKASQGNKSSTDELGA